MLSGLRFESSSPFVQVARFIRYNEPLLSSCRRSIQFIPLLRSVLDTGFKLKCNKSDKLPKLPDTSRRRIRTVDQIPFRAFLAPLLSNFGARKKNADVEQNQAIEPPDLWHLSSNSPH